MKGEEMLRHLRTGAMLLAVAAGARAADGTPVELDGLKSTAPASWKKDEPTEIQKQFRKFQFRIAKESGDPDDAEVVVFFFGPGGGGGKDANLQRWKSQFKPPAGENAKVDDFKVGDVPVTEVDMSGTYLSKIGGPFNPNAKIEEKPDYRMVNVILETKNGPYFMRLLGPAKAVDKHKREFDAWLKNFK
jgi:hypothetical protein